VRNNSLAVAGETENDAARIFLSRRQQQGLLEMISTLKCLTALSGVLASALFAFAIPASAQAPTDAQRSAIRSACRSDYQAHCASVPPGGMASLQCLQQNMSSLSASCQTAVRAVEPPPAPKADTAPARDNAKETAKEEPAKETAKETPKESATAPARPAAETAAPKVTTAPAAKKPSSAQLDAIRSACRSDYMKSCLNVPPGGAASLSCLEKNKSKLSPSCEQAVNAAGGGAKPPAVSGGTSRATAPATAPADTPAPAPALVLRPMLPREELFVLRSACGEDVRALCSGVMIGGGRVVRCLASQAAALSPACRGVLGQFAAQ
jgi:hypothetical protein